MRPHRRQLTRLPRPWDSPLKNTGVGCHFLLQCMKVKSESEVSQVVSDPQRPHGLQPSRLLCPWDFPGKSTRVGCHCLLQSQSPTNKKRDFCPGNGSANEKSQTLFTTALSTFFSSIKVFLPLLSGDSLQLSEFTNPKLQFSADPIFAGEIAGSVFVSDQHFGGLYKAQRRCPAAPGLVNKQVWYPVGPIVAHGFSCPGV